MFNVKNQGHTKERKRSESAKEVFALQDGKCEALKDRIRLCAELAGSGNALAQKSGTHRRTLENYLTGKAEPKASRLAAIAAAVGASGHWLLTGEGKMLTDEPGGINIQADTGVREDEGEYALVPLYDVCAAAGHGAHVESEQVTDSLAFKREWIHQELHANPSDLYLIHVDGESMEPTLRPGDVILVDRRSAHEVPRDGVYVMRMDGSLLVKRLQRLPGRTVRVTSDNPAYAPFDLHLETPAEDLAIIGRVVWAGRRM